MNLNKKRNKSKKNLNSNNKNFKRKKNILDMLNG